MHLFFDLDNTLWDFRKNSEITLNEMYSNRNLKQIYNVTFEIFHEKFYEKNEQLWVEFRDNGLTKEQLRERRFKESFENVGIFNIELAQEFENNYLDEVTFHNHLVDGTEEILDYLVTKNYKIHVVSNGFEEVTNRKVNHSNLKKYIETITSAEEINVRKPEPEIFQHALNKAKTNLEDSYFIGDDWIADAIGAKNFGFKTIFFNALNEKFDFNDLIVVNHLSELKQIL